MMSKSRDSGRQYTSKQTECQNVEKLRQTVDKRAGRMSVKRTK